MKQILVYSDSLTWGIIPETRKRLGFEKRWPGVLEMELQGKGINARVIENCLNGRRTVWEDPFKPGRNGLIGIEQVIEMHSPLDLAILMLGTNDFQSMHAHNAWHAAQGMKSIVQSIKQAPIEPGMPQPAVLIVAPPAIQEPKGTIAPKFAGGDQKCIGHAGELEKVALETGVAFFDSGKVITSSKIDGVHLDEDQHTVLGKALCEVVLKILVARPR